MKERFFACSFVEIERNEIKMLIENNQRHTMLVAVEIFRISKSSVKNNFPHHDFVREKKIMIRKAIQCFC